MHIARKRTPETCMQTLWWLDSYGCDHCTSHITIKLGVVTTTIIRHVEAGIQKNMCVGAKPTYANL